MLLADASLGLAARKLVGKQGLPKMNLGFLLMLFTKI
jgi:hypothetical protein